MIIKLAIKNIFNKIFKNFKEIFKISRYFKNFKCYFEIFEKYENLDKF